MGTVRPYILITLFVVYGFMVCGFLVVGYCWVAGVFHFPSTTLSLKHAPLINQLRITSRFTSRFTPPPSRVRPPPFPHQVHFPWVGGGVHGDRIDRRPEACCSGGRPPVRQGTGGAPQGERITGTGAGVGVLSHCSETHNDSYTFEMLHWYHW